MTGAVAQVGVLILAVLAVLAWPGRDAAGPGGLSRTAARSDDRPGTGGLSRRGAGSDPGRSGPLPATLMAWRRGAEPTVDDAALLAELLAMALRSGGARHRAVDVVLPDAPERVQPLLEELSDRLAEGRDGGEAWVRWAARCPALGPCAAAWRLSEECGVALAPALEQAAATARARAAATQRLAASTAGARATMWLLTGLPLVGLVAAVGLGVSPSGVAASPAASASILVGTVLTGLGWLSSRVILARAGRPRRS